jgi:metal-responsive CopG/Arc/MetJ family transcriptional regulator
VKAVKTPIAIRFPDTMLAEIDAIAAGRLDEPDRSSIVRELVAEALEARKSKTRRK